VELNEKVVLITGAKGGLGNFVTKAFLDAGARVVGVSRSIQDSDFCHPRFTAIEASITGPASARHLADSMIKKWSRIDALVHLIGGFAGGETIDQVADETMERMFDLNFRSAFYILQAVLPAMRAQGAGRILAIGSRTAVEPAALVGAYTASKAALIALIRTVAAENKDSGISANVILPGTIDTPANRTVSPDADFSKWVHPCQIAGLLVHLASDRAAQINGAVIPVYGGGL
jgi:NAD(P)-dependent dehydrogenase (short-subunit alcohol dehydrogenase family)